MLASCWLSYELTCTDYEFNCSLDFLSKFENSSRTALSKRYPQVNFTCGIHPFNHLSLARPCAGLNKRSGIDVCGSQRQSLRTWLGQIDSHRVLFWQQDSYSFMYDPPELLRSLYLLLGTSLTYVISDSNPLNNPFKTFRNRWLLEYDFLIRKV